MGVGTRQRSAWHRSIHDSRITIHEHLQVMESAGGTPTGPTSKVACATFRSATCTYTFTLTYTVPWKRLGVSAS